MYVHMSDKKKVAFKINIPKKKDFINVNEMYYDNIKHFSFILIKSSPIITKTLGVHSRTIALFEWLIHTKTIDKAFILLMTDLYRII